MKFKKKFLIVLLSVFLFPVSYFTKVSSFTLQSLMEKRGKIISEIERVCKYRGEIVDKIIKILCTIYDPDKVISQSKKASLENKYMTLHDELMRVSDEWIRLSDKKFDIDEKIELLNKREKIVSMMIENLRRGEKISDRIIKNLSFEYDPRLAGEYRRLYEELIANTNEWNRLEKEKSELDKRIEFMEQNSQNAE